MLEQLFDTLFSNPVYLVLAGAFLAFLVGLLTTQGKADNISEQSKHRKYH
jgi:hypothetical protein